VVMVDDEVVIFGSKDHRNHVTPEILRCLLVACLTLFPPAPPLGLDLAHADRELSRAQLFDGDRRQDQSSNLLHRVLPEEGFIDCASLSGAQYKRRGKMG